MQIFVHDLCYNVQSPGGSISVKKNAQSNADNQDIAENIQFLTVGHRAKIREDFFKKPQKNRKHDTGVDGFYPEFPSTGKEADDQKNYIQDHGDGRQRQWYKVG